MLRIKSRFLWDVLAVLAAVAVANDAHAQAAPKSDGGNGEIVVTAQHRNESILRVPISITAQTQAQLDSKGLRTFADLARTVPGLNYNAVNDLDQPNVSINGIVSNVGSATTGVYLDETPIASRYICFYCGFTAFPQLFDLDRVEVLRGPQGTLFGAGSEGGTIRFITPKPSLTQWSGYDRADVGFTKGGQPSWELGSAVGGPIVKDVLGFRASFWTRTEGGYIDRVDRNTGATLEKDANHTRSYVGRVALTWQPTDHFKITPSVFFQEANAANRNAYWEAAGLFKSFNKIDQPSHDRQIIGSLDATYDTGGTTLTSITSYYNRRQRRQDDYTPVDLTYYAGTPDGIPSLPDYTDTSYITTTQKTWTQEFRLTTDSSKPLSFTTGLYFMHSRTSFAQTNISSNFEAFTQAVYGTSVVEAFGFPLVNGANYVDDEGQTDREYAIYGEATYRFTDRLKLALGGRFSYTDFDLSIARDGPIAGGPLNVLRNGNSKPFNPRASLSYRLGDANLYATAAKGFRVGGGNSSVAQVPLCGADLAALGRSDVPATYLPDQVWNYEVGAKSRLGRAGSLSGSLFYVDWRRIQTNVVLPICGYNYTANTGRAVSKGFEIEGSYAPVKGLTFSGSAGYTDAHYKSDVPVGSTLIIAAGTPLSTPKWQATASAEYDTQLGFAATGYLRTDFQYSSAYTRGYTAASISYDPDTNDIAEMKYVSARAGSRFSGLDLSVYVNNLFNARPILTRYHELPGTSEFRDITLRPRTIGITGTYRF